MMTQEQIDKLLESEAILNALMIGGVDSWSGYDLALAEYRAEKSRKEEVEKVIDNALADLSSCVEEPAGRGCGYGFTRDAYEIIRFAIKEARSIYND